MRILKAASVQDLTRLLDLFPVTGLRHYWTGVEGTKDEVCQIVAGRRDFSAITNFLFEYMSCCKQHIYIYDHKEKLTSLPTISLPDTELLETRKDTNRVQMLYVTRARFNVVLREPLAEDIVEFLWPFMLDFTKSHLIVRFVVLEKNIGTYVDGRPFNTVGRSVDEKDILQVLEQTFKGTLNRCDLHKGVKKLWDDDFMDATRTQYKKPDSTASEIMDSAKGIKKNNPTLYTELKKYPLMKSFFQVDRKGFSVTAFSVDPSKGDIGFPRYSDNKGDTDHVVSEILRLN